MSGPPRSKKPLQQTASPRGKGEAYALDSAPVPTPSGPGDGDHPISAYAGAGDFDPAVSQLGARDLGIRDLGSLLGDDSDSGDVDSGDVDASSTDLSRYMERPSRRLGPGTIISSRYVIVRYIARGGMGEVYEVEDLALQCVHVAMKIILPDIAQDRDAARRFEREVMLARKVSHPNLCPIYDISPRLEPMLFLTMKLLAGETLSARIQRYPPIARHEALAVCRQMIAGVAAMHAAGIIHRDIKPNNVMLDDSGPEVCVSIMDFGLARPHSNDPTLLAASTIVAGTIGFMAPEMLRGQQPSRATDLYALGVVLHLTIAGDAPSFADHRAPCQVTAAFRAADVPLWLKQGVEELISDDPLVRSSAFAELERCFHPANDSEAPTALHVRAERNRNAILRTDSGQSVASGPRPQPALSLEPVEGAGRPAPSRGRWAALARRPRVLVGSGLAVAASLTLGLVLARQHAPSDPRLAGSAPASKHMHIAVLPLGSTNTDPQTLAIGDGVMDSLAGRLSNLDNTGDALWVIPTSELRDSNIKTATEAMRKFGATLVIKSLFERVGNRVHLQLSVIDPRSSRQMGYFDLSNPMGDLAGLQDEAVLDLVRLLNITPRTDPGSEPSAATPKAAAYADYLAGLGYFERSDKADHLDHAIASLNSALQADPNFALGYALLSRVYIMKYLLTEDGAVLKAAEASGRKAAELDPQLPDSFVALAKYHDETGKRDLAVDEYQRALALDPQNVDALRGIAHVLRLQGRTAESETAYKQAAALRPKDWYGYNMLGNFYSTTFRPRLAVPQYEHAIALSPDNSWAYSNLAIAFQDVGDPKELGKAEEMFKHSLALDPNAITYNNLGWLYVEERRFPEAIALLQQSLRMNDQAADVWQDLATAYEWTHADELAHKARLKATALDEQKLSVNPEDENARSSLAVLYAQEGKKTKALEYLNKSLANAPNDPYVLSQVAVAWNALGEKTQAESYLRSALSHGFPRWQLLCFPAFKDLK